MASSKEIDIVYDSPERPTFPYVVHGYVQRDGIPLGNIPITIENMTRGGQDIIYTDLNGYYIYSDLQNLPNGYGAEDIIKVKLPVDSQEQTFVVD